MDHGSIIRRPRRGGHWVMGLVLVGLGTLFLLDNLAYIHIGAWTPYWPFIIGCVGVGRIIDARGAADVSKGGFLIFVAFWLYACLQHVWGLGFQNSWPMVLIALGLRHIFVGMTATTDISNEKTPS